MLKCKLMITVATCVNLLSPFCLADRIENNLQILSNAPATSGFEAPVRNLLRSKWQKLGAHYQVDGLGNLIGRIGPIKPNKPTVLIMAHMDEVGFITKKIDKNGFIWLTPLGRWVKHVVWSEKWTITLDNHRHLTAISGMDAPHMLKNYEKPGNVNLDQLFLDTGMSQKELKKIGMRPGLPVVPASKFTVLSNHQRYAGKAFDDRAGLAVMLEVMQDIKLHPQQYQNINIAFAATTQEEVGMRGAQAVYASTNPAVVLNLEAGIARDYPTPLVHEHQPKLGLGPTVFIFDSSMLPNENLVSFISNVANRHHIPMQWESEDSYGEDASTLQASHTGVAAVNIGIPIRYAHSHLGIMDRKDFDNSVKLLQHTLQSMNKKQIHQLRY